jgi:hypothetical protein
LPSFAAVHSLSKALASPERGHPFLLDIDRFTRLRVPRGMRRAVLHREIPKSSQLRPTTFTEDLDDLVEDGIDDNLYVSQKQMGVPTGDDLDKLGLDHRDSPVRPVSVIDQSNPEYQVFIKVFGVECIEETPSRRRFTQLQPVLPSGGVNSSRTLLLMLDAGHGKAQSRSDPPAGVFDEMRQRALAAGLTATEIEALSWRARDEALMPPAAGVLQIYKRLVEEAIASRRGHERNAG